MWDIYYYTYIFHIHRYDSLPSSSKFQIVSVAVHLTAWCGMHSNTNTHTGDSSRFEISSFVLFCFHMLTAGRSQLNISVFSFFLDLFCKIHQFEKIQFLRQPLLFSYFFLIWTYNTTHSKWIQQQNTWKANPLSYDFYMTKHVCISLVRCIIDHSILKMYYSFESIYDGLKIET